MLARYARDLRLLRPAARAYLYGSAAMGAAQAVPWALLALYLDARGFGKSEIGVIQSADSWGKVLVAIPAAILIARRAAGPTFVRAAALCGLALVALPFADGIVWTSALVFVAGLAMSVHYVAIAPFLFRHTGPVERAGVFGAAEAIRTLASVAGAILAGRYVAWASPLIGEADALGRAIGGAGCVSLVGALCYARIEGDTPGLEERVRLLPVVRGHAGLLARFALPQLIVASGAGFCIPFLALYFKDRFGMGPGDWGNLFSAGQILMTTGFLLTPFVLARLGFIKSIVVIELLSIPFFLMLAFTHSLPLALFAYLVRGALMNSTHPILKNFMMRATPPGAREMQTGINATLWGVGWVIGPILAGRTLDATGDDYTVLMCTTVVFYVVAALTSWLLLRSVEQGLEAEPGGSEPVDGSGS